MPIPIPPSHQNSKAVPQNHQPLPTGLGRQVSQKLAKGPAVKSPHYKQQAPFISIPETPLNKREVETVAKNTNVKEGAQKGKKSSFFQHVLNFLSRFLGQEAISTLGKDPHFEGTVEELNQNCRHALKELKNPDSFNRIANNLRKLGERFNENLVVLDALPDKFSLTELYKKGFQEAVASLTTEELLKLIQAEHNSFAKNDPLLMGMIFEAVQNRCLSQTNPRIHLTEVQSIALNTKVASYFSPFHTDAETTHKKRRNETLDLLGSGAMNSVFKSDYSMGLQKEGTRLRAKVFKPLENHFNKDPRLSHIYKMMGMSAQDPTRFAERNLVSTALANHLDTDVVVDSQLAVHKGEPGIVMEYCNWQETKDKREALQLFPLASVIDDANPNNKSYNPKMPPILQAISNNPKFKKDLSTLRTLDYLSGQFDRHSNNILVLFEKVPQGGLVYKGIKGIDNDCSWGSLEEPHLEYYNPQTNRDETDYHHFKGIPNVMDKELASNILKMTDDTLEEIGKDRLTSSEITAAKVRLNHLKQIIEMNKIPFVDSDHPQEWQPYGFITEGFQDIIA